MSHTVEYIYKLTDKVSGSLVRIAGTAATVSARMEQTRSRIEKTGSSIGGIHAKISELENKRSSSTAIREIRKLNGEIRGLERQAHKLENLPPEGFINRLRYANNGLGGLAMTALKGYSIMQSWQGIKAFAGMGMDMEQTRAKFSVLLGTVEKGNQMIGDLNKMANATPFQNADLIKNAETLLAFNVAGEKVLPTMQMLGDVAMGDKNKLQGLTLAFAQMMSTGRLMGQDLLQMINQGFNPLVELEKMTKRPLSQLKKDMEEGKISSKMVESAFQHATSSGGRFYQMMGKMSETGLGKVSTLLGKLQAKLVEYAEKLTPIIVEIMNFGIAFVDNIEPLAQAIQGFFMSFYPLFETIGILLESLGLIGSEAGGAGTIIAILTGLFTALAIPIKIASNGIKGLTQFFTEHKGIIVALAIAITAYRMAVWYATISSQGWTVASMLQYKWLVLVERAQQLLTASLLKNPFTAALVGITLIVGALMTFKKKAKEATDELSRAKEIAGGWYADQKKGLDDLFKQLEKTNAKSKERNKLVDELKQKYPGLNSQLENELRNTNNINVAKDTLTQMLMKEAVARGIQGAIQEKADALAKAELAMYQFETDGGDTRKQSIENYEAKHGKGSVEATHALIASGQLSMNDERAIGLPLKNPYTDSYSQQKKQLDSLGAMLQGKTEELGGSLFGNKQGGTSENTKSLLTDASSTSVSDLTSGGKKQTNIHISFRNLIENVSMYPQTVQEGVDKVADDLTEGMLRVINSSNTVATQ